MSVGLQCLLQRREPLPHSAPGYHQAGFALPVMPRIAYVPPRLFLSLASRHRHAG
jgi:hypothetical protein